MMVCQRRSAWHQDSGEERANNVRLKPPLWHLKVVSRAFQEDELAGLHGTPQSQHLIPTYCSMRRFPLEWGKIRILNQEANQIVSMCGIDCATFVSSV